MHALGYRSVKIARHLFRIILKTVAFDHTEALSRVGSFGNKGYLQKAVEMFEDFLGKSYDLPVSLVPWAFR